MKQKPSEELNELSQYFEGMADGADSATKSSKCRKAAEWLKELSFKVCGQGFIGCRGGEECGSDHK